MARYSSQHKQETRDRILQETRRVLRAQGVSGVTIAPLMQTLGLTHGGFYAHFGSREDLVGAAVGELCDRSREMLETLDLAEPEASLRKYIERYLSTGHRDSPEWGCPLSFLSDDLSHLGVTAEHQYRFLYRRLRRDLTRIFQHMDRPEPDADATLLLAELTGALRIARTLGKGAESDKVLEVCRRDLLTRIALQP